jgi:uncharacterized membrane protein
MQLNDTQFFERMPRPITAARMLHARLARDLLWVVALLAAMLAFAFLMSQPTRSMSMPIDRVNSLWTLNGGYDVEHSSGKRLPFRWTRERAMLTLPNPGGAFVLTLRLAGGPSRSVPLTVQSEQTTMRFPVRPELRTYALLLPPHAGEQLSMTLYAPALQDPASRRTLGVVLGDMRISAGGMLPFSIMLPLLLAIVWGYTGLRMVGWRPMTGSAIVVTAGMWLAAWQSLNGWQEARFQSLLLTSAIIVGLCVAGKFAARQSSQSWPGVTSFAWLPRLGLSADRAFMIVGLIAGALLLCVTPPFQAPDEPAHFYRAYQITDGALLPLYHGTSAGGYLPSDLMQTTAALVDSLPFHPEQKQTVAAILSALMAPPAQGARVFAIFSNTAVYSPVAYAPQALGIIMGRLLGLSPLALMYFGRAANVLCYTLIVGFAIRTTPILKWVFFLLALMPMSMFQMASLSADGMTNGLSLLFIATVLHYAFGPVDRITVKGVARLAVAGLLLALAKHTFVLIVPLCLIIPVQRFGTFRRYAAACAAVIGASALAAGVWYLAVDDIHIHYIPGTNQDVQIQFMRAHPLLVIGIVLSDYVQHGWKYLTQFTGVLGWLDTPVPVAFLVSYWIMLYGTARVSMQQPLYLPPRSRLITAALLFGNMAVISALLYITWVPVGDSYIQGLQGRHFIPLSPLFFLLVYRYNQHSSFDQQRWGFVVFCYTVVTVGVTAATILYRYYVPV